jgi:hypothetical protein
MHVTNGMPVTCPQPLTVRTFHGVIIPKVLQQLYTNEPKLQEELADARDAVVARTRSRDDAQEQVQALECEAEVFSYGARFIYNIQDRILHSRSALGSTMLCDVISAVTEFMASVLHPEECFGIHDVAGVEVRPCVRSNSMPLGCPRSYQCFHKLCCKLK